MIPIWTVLERGIWRFDCRLSSERCPTYSFLGLISMALDNRLLLLNSFTKFQIFRKFKN